MSALISPTDAEKLARPHVARAWFATLDLPSGLARLHSGCGNVVVAGETWRGVTDPLGGRLVSISAVEEPVFGSAAAVTITLSGASKEFIQSVHATRHEIEGRAATIAWAAFDQETEEVILGPVSLFPRGRMTSPAIHWQGIGLRTVSITIESLWQSQNFAPGGRWNDADHQRRFPGDRAFEYVSTKIPEIWT